jgi:hypothetical protein
MVEDCGDPYLVGGGGCSEEPGSALTQYHDRHTMERMREHLVRADGELEAAQHFLDAGSAEGAEMDLIRAVAAARVAVGDALEAVRLRVGESDRG